MAEQVPGDFSCGFVAFAGRPNVGKSTLVNRIVGQELSIVTRKAQTTRNRIAAIHSLPNAQIILLDTPGIHEARTALNRAMVDAATKTLKDADLAVFVTTPEETIPEDDLTIIGQLEENECAAILAINKIDTVPRESILPVMERYSKAYDFREIFPVSALDGTGVKALEAALVTAAPKGPPLYPPDEVSDLPVRFFVAEIIREMIITMTGEEIPYKTAVVVESFKDTPRIVRIQADIHTEKQSRKKILVGKNGKMIKAIGTAARKKIEEFLERRVHLELFVKVTPNWTEDENLLAEFGYLIK